jgi:uncharacterized membrane protein YbaN (DUF454 family)
MRVGRLAYMVFGCLLVAIGIIGAFVPLLPTTIFLIAAAACFARSSERLEKRLLEDPRFGPAILAWRDNRAISKRGKAFAVAGMTFGFVFFMVTVSPAPISSVVVAAVLIACALYVVRRPTANM